MSTTRHKQNSSEPAAETSARPDEKPGERTDPETAEELRGSEEKTVESDLAALTDRLLRLQADFDNYRKRVQRDQADIYRRSLESLIRALLPVLDHLELGIKNATGFDLPETLVRGFALVCEQLKTVLARHGLTPVDAVGSPFDPLLHESVSAAISDSPRDTVVEQLRRGYRLGDSLLRPAQVILSLGPDPAGPSETATPPSRTIRHAD